MHRLLLVIVVLLSVGCGGQPEPSADAPATTGNPANPTSTQAGAPASTSAADTPARAVPEQLRFTAKTVDGRDFDGSSLAGKPAVLWFWAPWCPNCRAEAGDVARIAKDNAGKVTFVGVAAQDQVPAMRQFVEQYGVDFTHVADVEAAVWRRFGVTYQPAYAFVDSSGQIEVVKKQLGGDELAARVAALT
jgi:thiol-disulfide isomerase/thioredoxin